MRLPLAGVPLEKAGELSVVERSRVHMSEALRLAIIQELKPGTTLLVTRDTLRSSGAGTRMTIIEADRR